MTDAKVNHPFAKYDNLDRLKCILCHLAIKSSKNWTAHINGRDHRKKVSELKTLKSTSNTTAAKRVQASGAGVESKAARAEPESASASKPLPTDFFDPGSQSDSSATTNGGASIRPGRSRIDVPKVQPRTDVPDPVESTKQAKRRVTFADDIEDSSKPDDTDDSVVQTPSTSKEMAEKIPEGFFDDRSTDAKVRKVELKDPLDDEWEKFQKELKQDARYSDKVAEQEEDETQVDRDLEEIDDQISQWERVNRLEHRLDGIDATDIINGEEDNESDSNDELEYSELIDVEWRGKSIR